MTLHSDIRTARGHVIQRLAEQDMARMRREQDRQAYIRLPAYLIAVAVVVYVGLAYLAPLVLGWL